MKMIRKTRKTGNSVQVVVKNEGVMLSAAATKNKKWLDFKRKREKVDLIGTKFDETVWTW